jgi:predicted nucleotidyltransferase
MEALNSPQLQRIVEKLEPYEPERIVLFGSHARGEADEYSDLDLVIIKDTPKRFLDRLEIVYRYIQPDFALDALVYTPGEFAAMVEAGNPFIEQILREGVVLYERT